MAASSNLCCWRLAFAFSRLTIVTSNQAHPAAGGGALLGRGRRFSRSDLASLQGRWARIAHRRQDIPRGGLGSPNRTVLRRGPLLTSHARKRWTLQPQAGNDRADEAANPRLRMEAALSPAPHPCGAFLPGRTYRLAFATARLISWKPTGPPLIKVEDHPPRLPCAPRGHDRPQQDHYRYADGDLGRLSFCSRLGHRPLRGCAIKPAWL
jgi:hypothetical protein